jgi:hypothetical protein
MAATLFFEGVDARGLAMLLAFAVTLSLGRWSASGMRPSA